MNSGLSEALLMERIKEGSVAAFEELVRRWELRIFKLARGVLRNDHDALDARQETFIRVFRNARRFRPSGSLPGWIHRIALNACADIGRRRERDMRLNANARRNSEANPTATPAELSESTERAAFIRHAVGRLPERERLVVSMHRFEGLTLRQIAEALEVPLATVSSRLYSALSRLKIYLAPLMKEEA